MDDEDSLYALAGILEFCRKSGPEACENEFKKIRRSFGTDIAQKAKNLYEENETAKESEQNKKKINKEYSFK